MAKRNRPRTSRVGRSLGALIVVAWLLDGTAWAGAPPDGDDDDDKKVAAGRKIYEQGILPSGRKLEARRAGGVELEGNDARCALCHQHSGMGVAEGAVPVPPVTSFALFEKPQPLPGHTPRRAPGMQFQDYAFRTRPPYDDATLARAVREGISSGGETLNYMMPRYELSDGDMAALTAYLHTLSAQPSPGVDASSVHFATVIAPGVDPARKDATIGVLQTCFSLHSPEWTTAAPNQSERAAPRAGRLHVWELTGSADTWQKQLIEYYAAQPVFAVVSGLGNDEWSPVDAFCESNAVPCLFPNVDVPGSAAGGRYSFYFSKGVLLEAETLARYVRDEQATRDVRRIVQVHRADGAGAKAARALRAALADTAILFEDRLFDLSDAPSLANLPDGLDPRDALMLWLNSADLAALVAQISQPPAITGLFVSGLLGGLEEAPLTKEWKHSALMTYPYDPPARWNFRKAYNLRPWLTQHDLPIVDERLQGNTLAACNVLFDGMVKLRNRYLREHLVELTENYPNMGNAPAPQAYPRFSLGPGQRFSSKGAYIARFAPPEWDRLEKAADWIVP